MAAERHEGATGISALNEKALHAALKQWYGRPGDEFEMMVEGYLVDIVRGGLLIEIQTRSFSSIKRKLLDLVERHPVRLVHPIARDTWIVKLAADGTTPKSRRKSPKRGVIEQVFEELASFPRLLAHPNFSLEVVLTQEEEVRRYVGRRARRRRGWAIHERRLLHVVGLWRFATPADLAALIPSDLDEPFTTAGLAVATGRPRRLAQRMAYCLREMAAIEPVGKRRNAILYARAAP